MRFIDHGGSRVLLSDLSGIRTTSELQRAIRLGGELAQTQPLRSLRVLADLTGVEYSLEAFAIAQQSVAAIRPYVLARAVVGLPAPALIPFRLVAKIAGVPMAHFEGRDAALAWLISQG